MSHFRTNQVPYRLVPRFQEFESTNTLIGHLVLSQNVSIPFRFVVVCIWKVVVCNFGHRRIPNFRLEFVFNRKKKTNQPIFLDRCITKEAISWPNARQGTLLSPVKKSLPGDVICSRKNGSVCLLFSIENEFLTKTMNSPASKIAYHYLSCAYCYETERYWHILS